MPTPRYCWSFFATSESESARISAARSAAFVPLSRPTVPTGTPDGSWTIERIESRLSLPETGTPTTGLLVKDATNPGRAALRPAMAMKTSDFESSTYLSSSLWFRWLERTFVSNGMPSLSNTVSAFLAISRSLSEPMSILTLLVKCDTAQPEIPSLQCSLVNQTDPEERD